MTVEVGTTVEVGAGSAVLSTAAAHSAAAMAHFARRLSFEADVSDVHADLEDGLAGNAFVLVDSRSLESWEQGRIPGAIHVPTREIAPRAAAGELSSLIPDGAVVVTYCWGPGCNGATRAALEFARLGHPVKEMIGGFEYWVREGFRYDTAWGTRDPAVDSLTAPAGGAACAC
ncbi:MAG: rhodanese-like domain-containing protein [Actinocrinis sp.]